MPSRTANSSMEAAPTSLAPMDARGTQAAIRAVWGSFVLPGVSKQPFDGRSVHLSPAKIGPDTLPCSVLIVVGAVPQKATGSRMVLGCTLRTTKCGTWREALRIGQTWTQIKGLDITFPQANKESDKEPSKDDSGLFQVRPLSLGSVQTLKVGFQKAT